MQFVPFLFVTLFLNPSPEDTAQTRTVSEILKGHRVGFSDEGSEVLYVNRFFEEGTGEGAKFVLAATDGTVKSQEPLFQPEDEDKIKGEKVTLVEKELLLRKDILLLERISWDRDGVNTKTLRLRKQGVALQQILPNGKIHTIRKLKPPSLPHKASILAVHWNEGLSFVVLEIENNPGAKYLEGYNRNIIYTVIPISNFK